MTGGLLVFGTAPRDVVATVDLAVETGLVDATPALAPVDQEMAARLLRRGHDDASGRALALRGAAAAPRAPWVFGSADLADTIALWRSALPAPLSAVLVTGPPAQPSRDGCTTGAVTLAHWERAWRQMLEGVRGLPVLLTAGNAAEVQAFIEAPAKPKAPRAPTDPPTWPSGHRDRPPSAGAVAAPPSGRSEPASPVELSGGQRKLLALLLRLEGQHRAFSPPELPAETPTTGLLLQADGLARRQRLDLERSLATALAALEGLAGHPDEVPPPFEPAYELDAGEDPARYAEWRAKYPPRRRQGRARPPGALPTFTVIVDVDRPDPALARRCAESLAAQSYPNWHLRLTPAVHAAAPGPLAELAAAGAHAPAGDFVAFVGQHDELEPWALEELAVVVADDPEVDVVYTDEDVIGGEADYHSPRFKPDWSPDLLLSTMYLGGLLAARSSLLDDDDWEPPPAPARDLYDLALRVTERARRVEHVPVVAYHRRPSEIDDRRGMHALARALDRRGEAATVEDGLVPQTYRVRRVIATPHPLVSIIVPFRDGAELLRQCVASVHRLAGYDRWELVLVDNQSWEPETTALLGRLAEDPKCRVLEYPHPYNWSSLNNFGARHAHGDMLLFLNSDVEGRADGWLSAMVEHAQRHEVGAVGARLVYGDGSVQHGGVVLGLSGGIAWHAFWKCPGDHPGYLGHAKTIRNYSAVTGACTLVRRDAFDEVGGLDEELAILFNDVDLCLRLRERGYLVVYTPYAELFHYESKTRGFAVEVPEVDRMRRRWDAVLNHDPYFNPNLDLRRCQFALPR
ncbi:MAG TPA: glycosyltransferase [Acidimicrobiales bacterium]|jgi:GT2 family glycosyltransferase|nr:glycosyltransferase [Acidimicrobiales bacterium]